MSSKRVAIACQGGGSQCAFVAGALKTLFGRGVQDRFRIVGLSGTSGGALTAALAWTGLLLRAKGDRRPIEDRIIACWKDLSAQTPREVLLDGVCTQMVRLAEHGLLPTIASSPSSLQFRLWAQAASRMIGRPEFTDLRALVMKHIDFEALPTLLDAESPTLLLGAGDILEGSFKIFSSALGEISIDSVLASAAIPNLFPAVQVDGHAYWDGIFASNPPVISFLRAPLMGKGKVPDEIWIIQVNRTKREGIPEAPSEISDRRNDLAGNLSLQHELEVIDMVNMLLQEGALTPGFRSRFGLDTTERITVRFIRMSQELQETLDYPSKMSRLPAHIDRLIADGELQAAAFLSEMDGVNLPPDHPFADDLADGTTQMGSGRPS
ncbi:MAG TPA: patatin-like phospholipase family protein [Polyangia bacterium]|nr:patatin-like phospholipase family protein [Polyangia bacterium]